MNLILQLMRSPDIPGRFILQVADAVRAAWLTVDDIVPS